MEGHFWSIPATKGKTSLATTKGKDPDHISGHFIKAVAPEAVPEFKVFYFLINT
jgi:hypothetical protein